MDDLFGTVGTWTSLSDPAVAEIAAGGGFDFVVVDTEHTPLGLESVADCVRGVEAADGNAVVRVPSNDPVRIKRLLDVGADGLLVPMVDTAEEAQAAVEATRYPPEGGRGVAAARAADYGRTFENYVREGHRSLSVIVQIESGEAVDNAADIAAVEGVDALFVGPADLSASLGRFAEWTDAEFLAAIEATVDAAEDAGVPVGTLGTTPEQIEALGSLGFDYMVAGADFTHLVEGQRRALAAAEDVLSD
ncbi:aldolase [Natronomonas halophila]|uniref:HpcH/HpaI aldolase family protein n=1 Tax=Natronomonas halophila TaxID=2747817 RepID=UPI0015B69EC9|nr:aldolase/citrate lyase family protein [Natronomonas halophila]QLD86315.1 aldolase [Natronomonas halophila]